MKVYSAYREGRLTIYLQGELDQHEARGAISTIERLLDEYLPRDCALDLSGLTFMDSSGIALILKLHRRLTGSGGRAWIENVSAQPLRVLDASGIDRVVNISLGKEAE